MYKEHLTDAITASSILNPGTKIGPFAAKMAEYTSLKKLLAELLKVRQGIIDNMGQSGTHSADPMDFTAAAISAAKVPLYITKQAAFYFFVMCDAHQAVAAAIQRDLPINIKCNTYTISISSVPILKSNQKPPAKRIKKGIEKGDNVDEMARRLSNSLETSDAVAREIAIGNRMTNTDSNIAMRQATKIQNQEAQVNLLMKLSDPNLDARIQERMFDLLLQLERDGKKIDEDIQELKKTAIELKKTAIGLIQKETGIVPVVQNRNIVDVAIAVDESDDDSVDVAADNLVLSEKPASSFTNNAMDKIDLLADEEPGFHDFIERCDDSHDYQCTTPFARRNIDDTGTQDDDGRRNSTYNYQCTTKYARRNVDDTEDYGRFTSQYARYNVDNTGIQDNGGGKTPRRYV